MKKTSFSAALVLLLAVMMLIVSCGEDPFFHYVSIKYEDKVVKTEIVRDGEEYTLPKEVEGIPEIGGWTIGGKEYDAGKKITVTGDITITAVIGTPVVITLYDDVTETIYLRKGETELTLPDAPQKRAGYDFDGWNVDGATVKAEGKVTYKDGMKIKAIWTRYYTITYNANEGTGSVAAGKLREDNAEGIEIASGTLLSNGSLSFSGWNTQADGKGKAYAAGDVYKTKADLTLYAVWLSEVTVTYRYGDKSYTVSLRPSEVATWDGTLEDGTKWTKDGFVIDSWYSDVDGTVTYYSSSSTIPEGVTLYPEWVDENLSFELIEGKTTYRACVNNGKQDSVTAVTIPALYRGEKVTEIGNFKECGELKSVSFEKAENIDSISESAFDWCEKLESIDLSGTKITEIRDKAFIGCVVLPTVKLPSTLTTIGQFAFYKCGKLTGIELPESLTSIGYEAFAESGLVSITIPKNVRTLGPSVEACVFYGCTDLRTVVIEEGLTALTRATFSGCTSLESVTLPDSLTSIDRSFYGCTSLTFINIPKSVTQIDTYAFDGCKNLRNINMEIAEADASADLKSGASVKWKAENATVNWGQKLYRLGDPGPAGGIVFYDAGSTQTGKYIDSNGVEQTYEWRYLEASAKDYVYQVIQSHEVVRNDTTFIFGFHRDSSSNSVMVVSDKTENVKIGSGRYNTTALVKAMGAEAYDSNTPSDTDKALYAAGVCDSFSDVYNGTTYSDWFLPSAKELEEMFKVSNLNLQNDTYWSSSEDTAVAAVGCNSTGVSSGGKSRTNNYYVRPVRAFL